ncbi:MAG TPA: DedA family protein [Candidatus Paceibacterota bacterium]|nr:DedA family protein [Candidatus Paceibacterota bacterium]
MLNFLLACVHLNPLAIVEAGGYLGLAVLVFAESGLLIGIFLPGDSLLFAAGLLSASGLLDPGALAVVVVVAAILGDSAGYWFGHEVGSRFLARKDTWLVKRAYIERTQKFYKKYGARAVVLARFVPAVRTLAPILAGVAHMRYKRFLAYNALGGSAWGAGMVALGYFLGAVLPGSEHYVLFISLGIIVLSFLPILWNLVRGERAF